MAVNLNFDQSQFAGPTPVDPTVKLQRLMSLRDMEARAEDRRMGRELQAANLESLAAERDSHIAYQQEQQAKLETEREAKSAEQAARGMLANHLKKGGGRTLDDFYGAVGPTYAAKFFGEYADAAEKQAKSNKEAYTAHAALGDDMAGLLVRLSSAGVPPAEIHEELGRYGASLQNQFKDDPIHGPMVEELVNDDDLRAGEAGWQRYVARSGHASEEQRKINEDKRKADLDALNQQEKQAQLDKIQAETALLGRPKYGQPIRTESGELVQFPDIAGARPIRTGIQAEPKEAPQKNIDPNSPEGVAIRKQMEDYQASLRSAEEQRKYDRDNPSISKERVNYWVDQLATDATPAALSRLRAEGKTAEKQVNEALARSGVNIETLTSSTRTMAQTARDLVPQFDSILKTLDDPKLAAKLGPVMGRVNEYLTGKIGSDVFDRGTPEFAALRTQLDLLKTGTLKAHFGARGGQGILERFDSLANSGRMDAATLKASLKAMRDFLNEAYVKPNTPGGGNRAPGGSNDGWSIVP